MAKCGESSSPPKDVSESLQSFAEGLGFESNMDEVQEDLVKDSHSSCDDERSECKDGDENKCLIDRYSRSGKNGFPPPISTIGKSGKPLVQLESYRNDGRIVLKEFKMPMHEFLHAYREDGRLKLQFVNQEEDDEDAKG
ncbi:uncharacterized protein LOC120276392 [Dioscorea cayenensis subsp. rotundata]|uniref:Uncharacterized protein LOC120276392 n=1 Tax=Dioscorea cayennensis subsp. rotundata TaxID=55577 RepID=A0AB40CHK7_DIOCR|nr:uncharacterized protein LOC120276392 [Dioscorea cayenensis subsp. rotundata]